MSKKNESRGANVVDVEPARDAALDVGEAVGERERELLRRRRAGLADVVAGDRDRCSTAACASAQNSIDVDDRACSDGLGRKDPCLLRDVFLQDVVLQRAAQLRARDALLLGGGDDTWPQMIAAGR